MAVSPTTLLIYLATSFVAGLVDVILDMGYGFTVTPMLLHLSFSPPAGCALSALLILRGRPAELLLPPQVRERRLKMNEGFTDPRCTAFKYPAP